MAVPRARSRAPAREVGADGRDDRRLGPDGAPRGARRRAARAGGAERAPVAHELSLLEAEELRPGIAEYLAAARASRTQARDRLELVARLDRQAPRAARARDRLGRDRHRRHDEERAKPRPTLYLEALELLGVVAGEAVVFEDSPNGVRAAQSARASSSSGSRTPSRGTSGSTRRISSSSRSPTCRRTSCSRASARQPHERGRERRRRRPRPRAARAGGRRRPAATPASRASTTSERPFANVSVTTSAARIAGATISSSSATRGGSCRAGDADRADRLQHDGAGADREHRCPRRAHARLQPTRTAAVAAMIGTPGGVERRRARRRWPRRTAAAASARRSPSCATSSARKSAANAPSSPKRGRVVDDAARAARRPRCRRPRRPRAPVPTPSITRRSKRGVPPPASAHDSSTTSCASREPRQHGPRNDCAMVIPIGA